jgi:hypothetical protein
MIGLEQWGLLVCDLVSRHRIVGSGGEKLAPIYYRVPGYIPQIFVFFFYVKSQVMRLSGRKSPCRAIHDFHLSRMIE